RRVLRSHPPPARAAARRRARAPPLVGVGAADRRGRPRDRGREPVRRGHRRGAAGPRLIALPREIAAKCRARGERSIRMLGLRATSQRRKACSMRAVLVLLLLATATAGADPKAEPRKGDKADAKGDKADKADG